MIDMEDLVLSIEQCKHLQQLGLDMSDAKLWWCKGKTDIFGNSTYLIENRRWTITMDEPKRNDVFFYFVPTYTLQETLENIPFEISDGKTRYELFIDYPHDTVFYYNFTTHKEYWSEQASSHRLIDSAYQMLVRYLTNK